MQPSNVGAEASACRPGEDIVRGIGSVDRRSTSVLREGLLAGLAGAAAVALWFFVHDLLAGEPLRTPALLGAALFGGIRQPSAAGVHAALVLKYTVVHVVVFALFGWLVAGLLALSDREKRIRLAVFMLFCCWQVVTLVGLVGFAAWLHEPLPWWSVLGANLVAMGAMLAVYGRRHSLVFWRDDMLETDDTVILPARPRLVDAERPEPRRRAS